MEYYKADCVINDANYAGSLDDPKIMRSVARKLCDRTKKFNSSRVERSYTFIEDIEESVATLGVFAEIGADVEALVHDFIDAVRLPADLERVEDVTFDSIKTMLRVSCRCDFSNDRDDIMRSLGLQELNNNDSFSDSISMKEIILEKQVALGRSETDAALTPMANGLTEELRRIYTAPLKAVKGHPVHYMIESDDPETSETACRILLNALCSAGRLESRRATFVEMNEGVSMRTLNALYKSCSGAAIVLLCNSMKCNGDESEADGVIDDLLNAVKYINDYRNDVLTVLCFPLINKKIRAAIEDDISEISFVEISERPVGADVARACLKDQAKRFGLRADRKLTARVAEGESYSQVELRAIFNSWRADTLRDAYPVYSECYAECGNVVGKPAKGNAFAELTQMIGLGEAKSVIRKALDYYKFIRRFDDLGVKRDNPAMHMVFTGNPGTAKTTVARLFASIMKDNGLLTRGHLVEVGRSELVGRYVGWTAKIVKDRFRRARGGVLFIDEAYSLVDDREGSFGDEAINTIVQEMENERGNLIVILAGYPDKMEEFIERNPGLRSRIAFHVRFDDYDAGELCDIAKMIGEKKGVRFSGAAMERLHGVFERARRVSDFGNGRYARNVVELAEMNLASRLVSEDGAKLTKAQLTTIDAQDIEAPALKHAGDMRRIGFAV